MTPDIIVIVYGSAAILAIVYTIIILREKLIKKIRGK